MARGEGIKRLSDLFTKYRSTLRPPEASVTDAVREVVEDVLGFSISIAQISYNTSSKIVSLQCKGPQKSECLLHKDELLAHLKGRLGTHAPVDII